MNITHIAPTCNTTTFAIALTSNQHGQTTRIRQQILPTTTKSKLKYLKATIERFKYTSRTKYLVKQVLEENEIKNTKSLCQIKQSQNA